jgi:hypothetical protein
VNPTCRHHAPPLLAVLAILAGLGACATTPTATVQLVLSTDPTLDAPGDLLAEVATVAVVVDAPGGLAGIDHAGALPGGGVAVDLDGDGDLEVVFELPTLTGPELPILEIGLAHNAGRELSFQVLGFAADDPAGSPPDPTRAVALGGVTAVVADGETRQVGTPFNLRAAARPPKVVLALPPDGATGVPIRLGSATVMFSTTVDAASAAAHARLVAPDGTTVPTTATLDTLTYAGAGGVTEKRSLLTLALADVIDQQGDYVVTVDPGVVSTLGRRFDQDPTTAAEDGFTSRFQVGAGVGGGTHPCDACGVGYVCNASETACEPVLDCQAGCGPAFVCDAAQSLCVEDCRVYGACAAAGASCDPATGLCR